MASGGGVGGSISSRKDMVNVDVDKKSRNLDQNEKKAELSKTYWTHCALTGDLLLAPIVITRKTSLFMNKITLVESMIRKKLPKEFQYIKTLKDIREIDLLGFKTLKDYVCPLSQLSPDNVHQFIFLWTCGHLFEERVYDVLDISGKRKCPICELPFDSKAVMPLSSHIYAAVNSTTEHSAAVAAAANSSNDTNSLNFINSINSLNPLNTLDTENTTGAPDEKNNGKLGNSQKEEKD